MFVDWGCGNLKVFVDGDSLLEIITATGSQTFYKPMRLYTMKNACYWRDWGKHDFSCGYILLWLGR